MFIYSQSSTIEAIFNKDAMEKRTFHQKIVLGKLDCCLKKNETRPLSYAIYKINSKWI